MKYRKAFPNVDYNYSYFVDTNEMKLPMSKELTKKVNNFQSGPINLSYGIQLDMLKFHTDWNWILEMVDAIENRKTQTSSFSFHIQPDSVLIKEDRNYGFTMGDGLTSSVPIQFNGSVWITGKNRKEAVAEAINQFLIWYEQKFDV
jgi:hypothetical protein